MTSTPATSVPDPSGARAWSDRATRRALARYGAKAAGWSGVSFAMLWFGTETLDENGDTLEGIPEFVSLALMLPGIWIGLGAVFMVGCLLLMTTAALLHPWRSFDSSYELLPMGRNGQPVLTLSPPHVEQASEQVNDPDRQAIRLVPAALVWRWRRFENTPTLLLASGSRHWGLVATPDLLHLAWATRSPLTEWYLRRRSLRQKRDGE